MTLDELAARGLRVTPLVWRETQSEIPNHGWDAAHSFGRHVIVLTFISMNSAVYRFQSQDFPTLEAAKAAAEAHHAARVARMIEVAG